MVLYEIYREDGGNVLNKVIARKHNATAKFLPSNKYQ
jgi:hypothetical protein